MWHLVGKETKSEDKEDNRPPRIVKDIMINLTVKTLKGGKFTIEVEPSNSVAEIKAVIVSPRMKNLRPDSHGQSLFGDRWASIEHRRATHAKGR